MYNMRDKTGKTTTAMQVIRRNKIIPVYFYTFISLNHSHCYIVIA